MSEYLHVNTAALVCILFACIQTLAFANTEPFAVAVKFPGVFCTCLTQISPEGNENRRLRGNCTEKCRYHYQWSSCSSHISSQGSHDLLPKTQITLLLGALVLEKNMQVWQVIAEPHTHINTQKHQDELVGSLNWYFSFPFFFLQPLWKERWRPESASSNAWLWHVASLMKPKQSCLLKSYRNFYVTNMTSTGTLTAPAKARHTGNYRLRSPHYRGRGPHNKTQNL